MPNELDERPYKVYRAAPRGLMSRLRGEDDLALFGPERPDQPPPSGRPRWWRPDHWRYGVVYGQRTSPARPGWRTANGEATWATDLVSC